MSAFLLQRVLLSLLTLWFASVLVFLAIRLLPGDAVDAATTPGDGTSREQADQLRKELGLDDPLPVQYAAWIGGAIRGDLGESVHNGRPVGEQIRQALPVSLQLALFAVALAVVTGVPLGLTGALTRGRAPDYVTRVVATLGLTVPSFVLALAVLLIAARQFSWTPPATYTSLADDPASNLTQFLLPSLILSFAFAASIARMTRSSVLDVLAADYVRTARAKGLPDRAIVLRHVLRNALVPIMTVAGVQTAALLGGSVVMESIFNLPGIGTLILSGVLNRDYPVIQSSVLVVAGLVLLTNLVVDLSYRAIDPRITAR